VSEPRRTSLGSGTTYVVIGSFQNDTLNYAGGCICRCGPAANLACPYIGRGASRRCQDHQSPERVEAIVLKGWGSLAPVYLHRVHGSQVGTTRPARTPTPPPGAMYCSVPPMGFRTMRTHRLTSSPATKTTVVRQAHSNEWVNGAHRR